LLYIIDDLSHYCCPNRNGLDKPALELQPVFARSSAFDPDPLPEDRIGEAERTYESLTR
jgi:hypothetical protein